MENSGIGMRKFLFSLPVILGAVALSAGIRILFYLFLRSWCSDKLMRVRVAYK